MSKWNNRSACWEVDFPEEKTWSDAEHLRKPGECNPDDSITKDVIADLREREKFGALKYGKYLTHHTTEDTMQHLYEELLDAALYIKTEMKKRKVYSGNYSY